MDWGMEMDVLELFGKTVLLRNNIAMKIPGFLGGYIAAHGRPEDVFLKAANYPLTQIQ